MKTMMSCTRARSFISLVTGHFSCGVAASVLAFAMSGCGGAPPAAPAGQATPAAVLGQPSQAGPSGAEPGPAAVDVATVLEQPLSVQLSLAAELMPYRSVDLHARVSGFVRSVAVDRGSRVRRGAVLAELEAPELAAQRAEAQSKLQAAEAQLAAVQSKAEAEAGTLDKLKAAAATPGVVAGNDLVVAEKALDASRSQVTSAQQLVEAARQAVSALHEMETYLRITAPFDGVVTERGVHPGALVGPASGPGGPPLLRMAEQDRLRLVVPVPEAYLASVAPGAELAFSVAAYPGQSFTGKVARASQAVEPATRTMAVELDVTNTDGRLTPGTFCQVRWPVTRTRPSLMVPTGSIATTTDRVFVIRIREGKAEWVDVKTGLTSGALIEVFGELRAGEIVAARGTDELRNGSAVRPRDPKPAT